tara:strand:+ start:374 stop:2104 length:1731 start_codon:yes stop_codon:yes gene_type:complete
MAKQNIKLTKNIISNKYSNNIHAKNFNKIAKSSESVDDDKIRDIYNDVFYSIPKKGKLSHTSLILKIYDFLYFQENANLEAEIDRKIEELNDISTDLGQLQNPDINQHPLYPNGSFLIAGENGEKYPGLDTIYIMQEGLKRPIGNSGNVYEVIRRANNLPYVDNLNTLGNEKFSNKYYVTIDELNSIPDGRRIDTTNDLFFTGNELKANFEDISLRYSSFELKLKCIGLESEDTADLLLSNQDFYLSGGCTVQYVRVRPRWANNNTVDDYNPEVTTLNMTQGQEVRIYVGRNSGNRTADDGIPNNVTYPTVPIYQYNGNNVSNYIKHWGEGSRFEGIINVTGRVEYQKLESNDIPIEPIEPYQVLNGLPSSFSIASAPPGNEVSSFGTRIIYPAGSNLYGDQKQESGVQEIFNDPNNIYYHPFFYGQPIIRYDNDYLIFFNDFKGNVGPINATAYAFLSLGKKGANDYPFGTVAATFYEDGYNSNISYTGIPQDTTFQNLIKNQIRVYTGNQVDDFFPNEANNPINWNTVKSKGRIKYHGIANIGTIGYNVLAPLKGTQNAFQTHNVIGPPSMPNV